MNNSKKPSNHFCWFGWFISSFYEPFSLNGFTVFYPIFRKRAFPRKMSTKNGKVSSNVAISGIRLMSRQIFLDIASFIKYFFLSWLPWLYGTINQKPTVQQQQGFACTKFTFFTATPSSSKDFLLTKSRRRFSSPLAR